MKRLSSIFLLVALLGVAGACGTGCATVQPYQRSYLAKDKMQLDPDPTATLLEQHVFAYREGSAGGYGGGGGGCGCN